MKGGGGGRGGNINACSNLLNLARYFFGGGQPICLMCT